jgi:hypothetical protein
MRMDPRIEGGREIEIGPVCANALPSEFEILVIQFNTDAITAPPSTGQIRRASSHEWIKHGVADE